MSQKIEAVRANFRAWNRPDPDARLELLHPDVEFHTAGVLPDFEPVYCGHRGVTEFWHTVHERWATLRQDLEHLEQTGDWVAWAFRFHAKGAQSGVEVDLPFADAIGCVTGLRSRSLLAGAWPRPGSR